jgi:hypothetical protein
MKILQGILNSVTSRRLLITAAGLVACQTGWTAQAAERAYSPYTEQVYPNRVYFGDTHLHTVFSSDAGFTGNRLTPDDAYRFARGELVESSSGVPARLQRPLDFLVVTDHAENLGLPVAIAENNALLLATEWGRWIHDVAAPGTVDSMRASANTWAAARRTGKDPLAGQAKLQRSMWERITTAAEQHNTPGLFTALIGFEWTLDPGGNNLHRNVIYRDDKDKADQVLPVSAYDTQDPEGLWDWMQAYETKTGGRVLAIPHNGNLSNGQMFDDVTMADRPLDPGYAERRMKWEPLYEVTQMKGDAEAHPLLSTEDEFADFETWDKGSFGNKPKTPDMLSREYAREVYKRGLAYEDELGANPFKFGLIGSSDSHTGLSTTGENNFFGKVAAAEPGSFPTRLDEAITARTGPEDLQHLTREAGASGLAGVWARENTREALWDAMSRKEVFATTGTRLRARVFGGWDFEPADLQRPDFAAYGYAGGVPMGGDLTVAPHDKGAAFMVQAMRDPDGANLDRIQIVKGWLDDDGNTHERVWDVAVSDGREIGVDGRCRLPVGNTVNVAQATYTNAIGEPILVGYWRDPDFDHEQRAFYYVRVLEIPTPRWTTYDASFYGMKRRDDVPAWVQDRAYTSPIWYSP